MLYFLLYLQQIYYKPHHCDKRGNVMRQLLGTNNIFAFMRKIVFLGIGILSIISCKNRDKQISLDSFKKIPTEIDGCSCLFAENDLKYKNQEYIFASNFDSIGFISVENKLIKLSLTEKKYKPNTVENEDYNCTYEGEGYKVIVNIKADKTKRDSDETWWNLGSIKVENKEGEEIEKSLVGESGC